MTRRQLYERLQALEKEIGMVHPETLPALSILHALLGAMCVGTERGLMLHIKPWSEKELERLQADNN
jgi:hypothetical protein